VRVDDANMSIPYAHKQAQQLLTAAITSRATAQDTSIAAEAQKQSARQARNMEVTAHELADTALMQWAMSSAGLPHQCIDWLTDMGIPSNIVTKITVRREVLENIDSANDILAMMATVLEVNPWWHPVRSVQIPTEQFKKIEDAVKALLGGDRYDEITRNFARVMTSVPGLRRAKLNTLREAVQFFLRDQEGILTRMTDPVLRDAARGILGLFPGIVEGTEYYLDTLDTAYGNQNTEGQPCKALWFDWAYSYLLMRLHPVVLTN